MYIKIARVRLHPKDDPNGYVVGFKIKTQNSREFNIDSKILFEDVPNDIEEEEVVRLAWQEVKVEAEARIASLESLGGARPTMTSALSGREININGELIPLPEPEPIDLEEELDENGEPVEPTDPEDPETIEQ